MARGDDLTPRELEILLSVAAGWPSDAMAEALDAFESDVFTQLEGMLARIRGGKRPVRSDGPPLGTNSLAPWRPVPERDRPEARLPGAS